MKITPETNESYNAALLRYNRYRSEETPDEFMEPLFDCLDTIAGIVPLYHCSGHGKHLMSLMFAVSPEYNELENLHKNPLCIIFKKLQETELTHIRTINSSLVNIVKRRDMSTGCYPTWVLRVNINGINPEYPDTVALKSAVDELIELIQSIEF